MASPIGQKKIIAPEELASDPTIGTALASTISELFRTGRTTQLDRLRERLPPGVVELGQVLSRSKIGTLHKALGITGLSDLEAAARAGRIRGVKGFGEKTEQKILADIEALRTRGAETLLHEATPVTRGVRYATLPFLFDEAGAVVRGKNLHLIEGAMPPGGVQTPDAEAQAAE